MLEYDNDFMKELEKGRNIHICFMSHNAYWGPLWSINQNSRNCQIDTFDESTSDLPVCRKTNNDYDLILLFSSSFYREDELSHLKKMANEISKMQNKRVTVGYSHVIPMEKRVHLGVSGEIKIISVKEDNVYQETIPTMDNYFTQIDFLNRMEAKHDELESIQVKKKGL